MIPIAIVDDIRSVIVVKLRLVQWSAAVLNPKPMAYGIFSKPRWKDGETSVFAIASQLGGTSTASGTS